jgi:hypothetical protein
MSEIYVSTDVEADGRIPGRNSMLSLGSAAFTADKQIISTFTANLHTLPGAVADEDVMQWWEAQAEAWAECRRDLQDPREAMLNYVTWLKNLPGKPVFVAYPVGYDFMFVYWYLIYFTNESPFERTSLDMKSFAMPLLNIDYASISRGSMPPDWFDPLPHTHKALDDAIEQGALFCNMLSISRRRS